MDPFVDYYESHSASPEAVRRFEGLRDLLLRVLGASEGCRDISVADVGCGAGTLSRLFVAKGCLCSGIDINASLVDIARRRAAADRLEIDFRVGSATRLPWADASFDIVVLPELLEHVEDWRSCLSELARVLKYGGVAFVSTTNRLCPVQQEFELPLYSWYPAWLKSRCVQMAKTSHRNWVNHAAYPAINWFDPYVLGAEFRTRGLEPLDRFDVLAEYSVSNKKRKIAKLAISALPLRLLGHMFTSGTSIIGRKRSQK